MSPFYSRLAAGVAYSLVSTTVLANATFGGSVVNASTDYQGLVNQGLVLDASIFAGATWEASTGTELGKGTLFTLNSNVLLNGGEDVLGAGSFIYYNADPVLNYSFAIQDFGAASSFSFTISALVVPAAIGPHSVRVDFGAFLTDGNDAGNNVGLTPNAPPLGISVDADGIPEAQVLSFNPVSQPSGVWVNAGYDLGAAASISTFGAIAPPPILVPSRNIAWDEWRFDLNFTGTGGGDAYAIAGRAEITPVPVPASLWLLGSAFGVTGLRRRRS